MFSRMRIQGSRELFSLSSCFRLCHADGGGVSGMNLRLYFEKQTHQGVSVRWPASRPPPVPPLMGPRRLAELVEANKARLGECHKPPFSRKLSSVSCLLEFSTYFPHSSV